MEERIIVNVGNEDTNNTTNEKIFMTSGLQDTSLLQNQAITIMEKKELIGT